MPRGPRQAGQKLKEPSAKEALVCEVKKAVSPLAFQCEELQYTFLAEENDQYGSVLLPEASPPSVKHTAFSKFLF